MHAPSQLRHVTSIPRRTWTRGRSWSAVSDRYTFRVPTENCERPGESETCQKPRSRKLAGSPVDVRVISISQVSIRSAIQFQTLYVAQVRGERENKNYTLDKGRRDQSTSDRCRAFELGTSLMPPPGRSVSLPVSELSVDGRCHRLSVSSRSSSRSPGG